MDFYEAYVDECIKGHKIGFQTIKIVVVADSLDSAKIKFNKYLESLKSDDREFISNEELHICDGIMISY